MADRDLMRSYRAQGMTYEQIGEKVGLSKQRVFQLVGGGTDRAKKHFRTITEEQCVYPNIRKWMNENSVSKAEFSRKVFGTAHPKTMSLLCGWLSGKGYPSKHNIDKLIEVTGLTYEELFKK